MKIRKSFIILLLLAYCFTTHSCKTGITVAPRAVNGTLDLRHQLFTEKVPLNGEWAFYWNKLANARDTSITNSLLVNFPFKWSGFKVNGKTLPTFGYATYKLTVILPKNRGDLSLAMPDVYCAYRLYLNGEEVARNGVVSTSAKGFVPYWQFNLVDVPPGRDTLRLTLQIANFVHSKSGINKEIFIGKKDDIKLTRSRAEAIDLLLTGCLFMGGLFFLGLFLLGNRDKAIMLFALYSIVYSYRIMGTDNYVLHTILPNLNWYVTVRCEYISLFSGIGLFGLYTKYLYPYDVHKYVISIASCICFGFAGATLLFSPIIFTQLINPFLIVMLFCLVYIPYVYTKAYRNKRPGSIYALLSAAALMFVFAISLFHYWDLIPPLQFFSFIGYISFFFLQSLVLSHRVSFVLKQARQQAEQGLTAKGEFLSTMSHEIRTPLNSVIGISHLLLKNDPREDQLEQLEVMLFSANNLLAIVNDILDYTKIEAGKIIFEHIEMDIISIANNIIKGLKIAAEDKGIDLKLHIDDTLKTRLLGDPTRLSQVITNLVHNAIKFTPSGYVELSVKVTAQAEKTITLKVDIKDTGIGISKEKQKLIFERFTQADSSTSRGFGGTGLGLAICKRILELQHTSLNVESETGKGAIFYFTQTFEKGANITSKAKTKELSEESDKPLLGINILLVEDNPLNVMVVQKFLQRWGATIDVAVNGLDALDKLDNNRHRLVLMDLHMPEMDGYESARQMRANGVSIPIIALTANLPEEIEEKVKLTGMNDIVVKPFLPDELYRKVLHYLSAK